MERLLGHSLPFHQDGELEGLSYNIIPLVFLTEQYLWIVCVLFYVANLYVPAIISIARAKGNINSYIASCPDLQCLVSKQWIRVELEI